MKKLIALVLALCMVLALAACGGTETPPANDNPAPSDSTPVDSTPDTNDEVKVMTYDEFVAAAMDSAVVVETAIQAYESWWDGEIDLYCQDETGAYYVYGVKCTEDEAKAFVPGAKVRVSGYKTAWDGEVEIVDAKVEVLDGTYTVEAAKDVTELFGTDALEAEMNKLVAVKGLTVAASKDANGNDVAFLYKWDGSGAQGDDLYFNVTLGETTYTFTVNAYMNGTGSDSDVYKAVEGLKIGDKIDVEGFLYWYNGAQPHLTSVTAAA